MTNLVNQMLQAKREAPSSTRQRTPSALIDCMSPVVRSTMSQSQLDEVKRIVTMALPQPSPKLIDLRFELDLLLARYYFVLFVGKDRRKSSRKYSKSKFTLLANKVAAFVLLVGCNLAISASIVLFLYLLKASFGINLLPGHLRELFD